MRFGIMAMQLGELIPPQADQLPAQEALANVMAFDQAALVAKLAGFGFSPIELGADLAMVLPHILAPEAVEKLAAIKGQHNLSYTVHLPLWSIEPASLHAPVRLGSVQALVNAVRATLPLEPEVYVLHATGALAAEFYRMNLPDLAKNFMMRQFQAAAGESIAAILAETSLPSRQLAIETIEFPFDLTLELADELDLSLCLDTGHVLVGFSGPIGLFEALERCLPRLAEVHLHDGPWQGPERKIGYGKDHQPLGTGDLDVARFLAALEQAAFDGPIIFELGLEQALASMEYIESLGS